MRACSTRVGMPKKSGQLPRRERIFRRDGYCCIYCGGVFKPSELTVDHVQPRRKGGDHSEGNLVTSCRACNTAKGGEPAWSYLARHPELRARFLSRAENVWPRLRRAVEEAAGQ